MEISIPFPEGALVCAAGDYLIRRRSAGAWRVYRVEDLLLVKRLLPLFNDPSTLLLEEHLRDSVTPAYADEVHLLLTAFDPEFDAEAEASQAVRLKTLTERAKGLLRPAREFTAEACRKVSPADGT